MKAEDIAGAGVLLVLVVAVGGGFFWWKDQQTRAENLAYEQIIDETVDHGIANSQLTPLLTTLNEHPNDRLGVLRALYADPIKSDRLDVTFGSFQGAWHETYAHIAEINSRPLDSGRFEAEVDERFGAGAYALMHAQYEAFNAAERANPTPVGSQQEATRQENMWVFREYLRTHGRYPIAPIRIQNHQVVEVQSNEAPTAATP